MLTNKKKYFLLYYLLLTIVSCESKKTESQVKSDSVTISQKQDSTKKEPSQVQIDSESLKEDTMYLIDKYSTTGYSSCCTSYRRDSVMWLSRHYLFKNDNLYYKFEDATSNTTVFIKKGNLFFPNRKHGIWVFFGEKTVIELHEYKNKQWFFCSRKVLETSTMFAHRIDYKDANGDKKIDLLIWNDGNGTWCCYSDLLVYDEKNNRLRYMEGWTVQGFQKIDKKGIIYGYGGNPCCGSKIKKYKWVNDKTVLFEQTYQCCDEEYEFTQYFITHNDSLIIYKTDSLKVGKKRPFY